MELLHFLDDPGVLLTNFDAMLEGNNAAFLQKCLSGLLVQEVTNFSINSLEVTISFVISLKAIIYMKFKLSSIPRGYF
jgi:hypothetical protein